MPQPLMLKRLKLNSCTNLLEFLELLEQDILELTHTHTHTHTHRMSFSSRELEGKLGSQEIFEVTGKF